MSPFITYVLIVCMAAYGIVLLIDGITAQTMKSVFLQTAGLGGVFLLLHITVDFPTPRRTFGGMMPAGVVALMLGCTTLGIAAHYVFYLENKPWS